MAFGNCINCEHLSNPFVFFYPYFPKTLYAALYNLLYITVRVGFSFAKVTADVSADAEYAQMTPFGILSASEESCC